MVRFLAVVASVHSTSSSDANYPDTFLGRAQDILGFAADCYIGGRRMGDRASDEIR